ncbi:DUF2927 domain-containing protein [Flavimaricola marinus]|uniref:DUF2927 domain-containing protein n=1 Tax=Flavimaricola marinus TaxID=1819565 RepID=A0A238LC97_9RHOB|nr:DUF2927 domain-containing protein [Flavimaricola marinus]SMY06566.1 hypothetical protein LOM8899_00693 [Flavimaricola marinus]
MKAIQRSLCAALLSFGVAGAALAEDFVVTEGPLSDEAFYRLVACRAAPGKGCSERMVRWPASAAAELGIGLASIDDSYPPDLAQRMDQAIDRVIDTLNGAGAGLRLVRAVRTTQADISVHLVGAVQGGLIQGTGNIEMDGVEIGAALVHIRWNLAGNIIRGTIAVASDVPPDEAYPVLLEEITQSLGLMTDIRNPYYEDISVFSEDSNGVMSLSAQDLFAIRRHYPPP